MTTPRLSPTGPPILTPLETAKILSTTRQSSAPNSTVMTRTSPKGSLSSPEKASATSKNRDVVATSRIALEKADLRSNSSNKCMRKPAVNSTASSASVSAKQLACHGSRSTNGSSTCRPRKASDKALACHPTLLHRPTKYLESSVAMAERSADPCLSSRSRRWSVTRA